MTKNIALMVLALASMAGLVVAPAADEVAQLDALIDATVTVVTDCGTGSGFVIAPGVIMTAKHVVDDVGLMDTPMIVTGRALPGMVTSVWVSPDFDVAIISYVGPDLQAVELADADAEVGDVVTVIGSPLGMAMLYDYTSVGIISVADRDFEPYGPDMFFTDASANPGNSGGPVFNEAGEVIGMITVGLRGANAISGGLPASVLQVVLDEYNNG